MKILYAASVMHSADFEALFTNPETMPGQQAQKYHRLMLEGLAANGASVETVTAVPVTRRNHRRLWLPAGKRTADGVAYRYLSVCNLPVIKNLWQMAAAFGAVLCSSRREKTAVVCDVLNASVAMGAAAAAKLKKRPCIGIVTDLPDLMVTGIRTGHIRLVNRVIRACTGYVVLTDAMNAVVNPTGKPAVVIEGLCDGRMEEVSSFAPTGTEERICIYAGYLDARYGVKTMVDAFVAAAVPGASLHVYGNGPYGQELQQVARDNSAVVYHGNVLNREVVGAEQRAALLINPRPTHEEFTKYSFPSKNMEYMVSGTPVLTTELPGMPEDYKPHVYLITDETTEGMARALREVLALPGQTLEQKGLAAKAFVLREKSHVMQAGKLLRLIMENET